MRSLLASSLTLLAACTTQVSPAPAADTVCDQCGACAEEVELGPATHELEPIDYADPPPAGGPHNGCWASWGVYETEVPDDNWVHNLEHGGIIFLYRCDGDCDGHLPALTSLAQRLDRTLLTPYAALPTRFAVVAWGRRLLTDCYDEAAFEAFHEGYYDRAPESVASDAPPGCP